MSGAKVIFIVTSDNYLLLNIDDGTGIIQSFGKFQSPEKAKKHAEKYRKKYFSGEKDYLIVTGCEFSFNEMCKEEATGFQGLPLT